MKKLFVLVLLLFLAGCKSNKITYETMLEKEGSYYVYFYQNNCEACKITTKILNEHAKSDDIKVYFYNVREHRFNLANDDNYSSVGATHERDVRIRVTPELIYVVDGKVTKHFRGANEISDHFK